jgi:hypothetical protein
MADSENKKQEENSSFRVQDKRLFNADGSPVLDSSSAEKKEVKPDEKGRTQESDRRDSTRRETGKPPKIDFASFILSLATSAMANLGEVPDPETGQLNENLEAAQQMIDILTMLEQKTKGNLEPDEDNLLENLLYELRMKFLSKSKIIHL